MLLQSEQKSSNFVHLTASDLDNLVRYLRGTKTDKSATTFSLKQLASVPSNACYTPNNIEIDINSDMFRVTFTSRLSRLSTHLNERYYLYVRTLGQLQTINQVCVTNVRPKIKIYWHSDLQAHPVMGRVQICQVLIACRNRDHIQTILASPQLLHERRGFTEVEHISRELGRTHIQDLTCLSREMQQRNVGQRRLYLHDVDPAVTRAYRLSRCPIHLLSNHEHEKMRIIQMLRNTKPNLNAMDLGGPLYQTRIPVWCDGQMRYVPLCEAPNCTLSRHIADSVKSRMIISLALLVVSIAHRLEGTQILNGTILGPDPARLPFLNRNMWLCLRGDASLETVFHDTNRMPRHKKSRPI